MSLKYIKSGGIKISNTTLPAVGAGGPPEIHNGGGRILVPGPDPINNIGAAVGRATVALGLMQWMDSHNVPNPYTFFAEPVIYGFNADSNPEKAKEAKDKWNKQFMTLGNGKFEVNDVLAFPVNWGTFLIDKAVDKAVDIINDNKKKKKSGQSGNENNGSGNGENPPVDQGGQYAR